MWGRWTIDGGMKINIFIYMSNLLFMKFISVLFFFPSFFLCGMNDILFMQNWIILFSWFLRIEWMNFSHLWPCFLGQRIILVSTFREQRWAGETLSVWALNFFFILCDLCVWLLSTFEPCFPLSHPRMAGSKVPSVFSCWIDSEIFS